MQRGLFFVIFSLVRGRWKKGGGEKRKRKKKRRRRSYYSRVQQYYYNATVLYSIELLMTTVLTKDNTEAEST